MVIKEFNFNLNDILLFFFFTFSDSPDGLCCKLLQSCLKPRSLLWAFERGKHDEYATERESIVLIRKLGSGQFAEVWLGKQPVIL